MRLATTSGAHLPALPGDAEGSDTSDVCASCLHLSNSGGTN